MSLVDKLVKHATGQADLGSPSPKSTRKEASSKPSLVSRLATISQGGKDPVVSIPEKKACKKAERAVKEAAKKLGLVQKLATPYFDKPFLCAGVDKMAEVRFENMESAQKSVTKIYEQTEKALDDLQATGQDLQRNNLDLASQKVIDMAHSLRSIKENFEAEFPHLMKFTAPAEPSEVQQPLEEGGEPMPEEQAQPQMETSPSPAEQPMQQPAAPMQQPAAPMQPAAPQQAIPPRGQ